MYKHRIKNQSSIFQAKHILKPKKLLDGFNNY